MSIVRINAITVPAGEGPKLQSRFEHRIAEVERADGFEGFELLRPDEDDTWFVYTRWRSVEDFDAWVSSESFARGHAHGDGAPAGTSSHLLAFDVAIAAAPADAEGAR
ncbi:MAG: antibiotic biosynthesis monooxygenase family protein [Acidimicrobiales bacterium]